MVAPGSSDTLPPEDTKRHYAMGRKTATAKSSSSMPAGSATAVPHRDPNTLFTDRKQLQEEQLVALLAGFLCTSQSEDSVAAPLAAAVARMQARMQEMNTCLTSSNSTCLKDIKQAAFARNGSTVPTTSTAQTLLATACKMITEAQSTFVFCQREIMTAVSDSLARCVEQNYVVFELSAKRTNDLQNENKLLKSSVSSLALEVNDLKVKVAEMRASLDAMELKLNRERPQVMTVQEELLRGRRNQRSGSPLTSALRLRSASRASSCDSLSSTRTQISMARSVARSRRPSMGPAVPLDAPPLATLRAPTLQHPPHQHDLHQTTPLQLWPYADPCSLDATSENYQPVAGCALPFPLSLQHMPHQQMLQQDGQPMLHHFQIPAYLPSTISPIPVAASMGE